MLIPSRRQGEITYYETPTYLQVKAAVKPFERRHKRKSLLFPLVLFLGGLLGLIWLLVSIWN